MSEWHTGWTEGYASARSEAQAETLRLRAENEKLNGVIQSYQILLETQQGEIEKLRAALKRWEDTGLQKDWPVTYDAAALKETVDE